MAFLRRQPPHADAPRPDLVLLDLNLPRKDGRDTLAEIKGDHDLRRIPVVILTTSGAEEDIVRSYDLHANVYVQKPLDLDSSCAWFAAIDDFYLSVVRLPRPLSAMPGFANGLDVGVLVAGHGATRLMLAFTPQPNAVNAA